MLPEEWTGTFVFYHFGAQSIFLTVSMSIGYGKVKHEAAYPRPHRVTGNRDVLYLSAVR